LNNIGGPEVAIESLAPLFLLLSAAVILSRDIFRAALSTPPDGGRICEGSRSFSGEEPGELPIGEGRVLMLNEPPRNAWRWGGRRDAS